jgi:hypothetical protein
MHPVGKALRVAHPPPKPPPLTSSPQDTRRILQEEISSIRTEIFRRESSAKYDEDKKRANELGYGGCQRRAHAARSAPPTRPTRPLCAR